MHHQDVKEILPAKTLGSETGPAQGEDLGREQPTLRSFCPRMGDTLPSGWCFGTIFTARWRPQEKVSDTGVV
jgi:hypothetical protein